MNVEFVATDNLSDSQKIALNQLCAAVYPPEVIAMLPGRFFSWASPQWSILLWDQDELVARVGLVAREIHNDGMTNNIGGVGGVMTHPDKRGKGLASQAMCEASKHFDTDLNVSYALLFCGPPLIEFYKRLMWKPFQGKVFVQQPQGKVEFSTHGPMVLDVKEHAPLDSVLDLNGLPW